MTAFRRSPFPPPPEWEKWLEDNHAGPTGVWVKIAKKGTGIESVRYPEVLESALCFGWIDGRREALDERYFLQRFTPRRSRSNWSRINRETAERLIAEGRMRPGRPRGGRAGAGGRPVGGGLRRARRASQVPADLRRELDARPRRQGVLRRAQQPEPLRDPLPPPGCEEARDTRAAAGEVRGDARGGREDLPLTLEAATLPSMATNEKSQIDVPSAWSCPVRSRSRHHGRRAVRARSAARSSALRRLVHATGKQSTLVRPRRTFTPGLGGGRWSRAGTSVTGPVGHRPQRPHVLAGPRYAARS